MRKHLKITIAGLALAGTVLASVATASATPNKSTACATCHGRSTAVRVAVAKVASTAKVVTYRVQVSGGSGVSAYVVFNGTKVIARRTSTTGTFKVAPGKAIRVWAVKSGSGANYKALTSKR
jgi:hypothetical protein